MQQRLTRRRLCIAGVALASVGLGGCLGGPEADPTDQSAPGDSHVDDWEWSGSVPSDAAVQYHDPDCGCCAEYVTYLERHGIAVDVEHVSDLGAAKTNLGVPLEVRSCHTLAFEGTEYLVEGHVPLEAIETLFAERPDVRGITIPGMPQYAPGMGPRGDEPLQVYTFDTEGSREPYTTV